MPLWLLGLHLEVGALSLGCQTCDGEEPGLMDSGAHSLDDTQALVRRAKHMPAYLTGRLLALLLGPLTEGRVSGPWLCCGGGGLPGAGQGPAGGE